jgi:hypothetical protein
MYLGKVLNTPDDMLGAVPLKGKQAIVRVDTDEVLSIVSDRYEVTQHQEIFEAFNSIKELEYVKSSQTSDGGVCFWNFNIKNPDKSIYEVKKGDIVSFSIRAFNSHNFLTGRGGELYANRLICTNGMVMPTYISSISFKHMNNNAIGKIDSQIEQLSSKTTEMVEIWKQWLTFKPDTTKINAFVNKLDIHEHKIEEIQEKMYSSNSLWEIYNC